MKISNNPRFSTASSLEGDEHLQLDQLVVAQVHHDPIQEKRVEEEQESKSNNQFHIKFLDNYQTSTYYLLIIMTPFFFNSLVSSEEVQDQGRDVEEVKKVSEVDDSKEHINEDSIQNTESYSIAGILMFLLYLPFLHIECIKYLIIYSIYFLSLEMHCYVNSLEFYIPYTRNILQNNMHYDDFTQICSNNHISDDELGELRISFESLLSFRSSVFIRIENTSSSRTTLNESPTQSEYFSATEDR